MAKKKESPKKTKTPEKDRQVKQITGNKVQILTAEQAEEWRSKQQ